MAIVTVQSVATVNSSTIGSAVSATLTPTANNLLLAFLVIARQDATSTVSFTGGNVNWAEINSAGSGTTTPTRLWYAIPTAATAVSVAVTYTGSASVGGKSLLVVSEVSGYGSIGVSTGTSVFGASTLLSVSLTTTSANSAIYSNHGLGEAIVEGNFPAGYAVISTGTVLGPAGDYGMMVGATADAGVVGAKTIQWGTSPGTSISTRRTVAVEITPSAAVTFNYNLIDHRVGRGVLRGVGRGL